MRMRVYMHVCAGVCLFMCVIEQSHFFLVLSHITTQPRMSESRLARAQAGMWHAEG